VAIGPGMVMLADVVISQGPLRVRLGRLRIEPQRPVGLRDGLEMPARAVVAPSPPDVSLGAPRIPGPPPGVDELAAATLEDEGPREEQFVAAPDAERMLAGAELEAADPAGIERDYLLADTDVDARLHHSHDQGPLPGLPARPQSPDRQPDRRDDDGRPDR